MNEVATEHRFEVKATAESHFSWLRTRLSVERTLMSWMRTATALIGFGFTIVQFFQHLQQMPGARPPVLPDMPRYLGLALIASGTSALLISLWQYHSVVHYLSTGSFSAIANLDSSVRKTPLAIVAIFLSVVGIFAFGAVLLRLT